MTSRSLITHDRLRELLDYDPETGVFRWKVARSGMHPGDVAGTPSARGYINIGVSRTRAGAHRLAWFYVHGVWPSKGIDHINGNCADNRIVNLREANQVENLQNSGRRRNNKSGYKGVSWHSKNRKWVAWIAANVTHIYLGRFDNIEDAADAYRRAADQLHGEFANHG